MTLARIQALLEAGGARRSSIAHPIYELSRPFSPFGRRSREFSIFQAEVLDSVRALPWPKFLAYAEDPQDWEMPGFWRPAGEATWTPPAELSSLSLLDAYLEPGGWKFYLAPSGIEPAWLPDSYRSQLDDVVRFSMSHRMPVLVDAWHDNTEWRVLVEPSAVPGASAA